MGYIFETEIVAIIHTVQARTIGEGDSILLKNVMTSDIHPALKAYILAEVEKLLQQEREKEVRSKRFSYALPEIVSLQRQIDILLVQEYEFTRGEFESVVDEAVHFQFNFLCRPQWTLLSFVLENNRTISATELERKLRYAVEYQYFRKLIRRYVVNRGLVEVSYEELRDLLERIDREIVAQHSALELARMTRPLLAFIEAGQLQPKKDLLDHVLPINAAIVFFEDKKLDAIKSALESERDGGTNEITVSQLAVLIARVRGETPSTAEEPSVAITKEREPDELADHAVFEFVHKLTEAPPTPPAAAPEAIEKNEAASNIAPPLLDVYTLFSPSDQKLFIRKLFKKNEVEFRNTLDGLESLRTWEEASVYLDSVFQANDVDPFSKEAIRFTDVIQSRYLQPPSGNPPKESIRTSLRDKSALG